MAWLDNLREYFPLNEASGNAVGLHVGHTLTDTAAVGSTTGRTYGVARTFAAGAGQVLSMLDHADVSFGDQDWTIGFEIKFASTPGSDMGVVQKGSDSEYKLQKNSGNHLEEYIWSGPGSFNNNDQSGTVSAAVWLSVLMGYDAANNLMRLVVDGVLATQSWSLGTLDSTGVFAVGSNTLDASIGALALWSRLLTGPEEAAWPVTYAAMGGGGGGGGKPNHYYQQMRGA